jgi:hypothetical protein
MFTIIIIVLSLVVMYSAGKRRGRQLEQNQRKEIR